MIRARTHTTICSAALAAAGLLACSAGATPVRYSGALRQIRACVLVSAATSTSSGSPNNPVPYVFYALDSRADYKPNGWTFVNPLAASNITQQMYARWQTRQATANSDPAFQSGTPQAALFQVGAPLTKNLGAYWEMNLDSMSDSDLAQYDVIFLPLQGGRGGGNVAFDPVEREKLRHYVDAGGTLWVENDGSNDFANDNVTGQFIVNLRIGATTPSGFTIEGSYNHPLLSYPYAISPIEVSILGESTGGLNNRGPFLDPTEPTGYVNPRSVIPLLLIGNVPTVYAGDLGAGHLILTEPGVGADLNDFLGGAGNVDGSGGANDGAVSGGLVENIPQADMKFAYNIAAWASSIPAPGDNARRTGSNLETVGYDLGEKWASIPAATAANPGAGAVVTHDGAFYVDGNNVLHAYNAHPGLSLSGTLFPDDGIPDFVDGTPYDEIWNYQLPKGQRWSTPTVVSVYGGGFDNYAGDHEVVAVTSDEGITRVFEAFPRNAQGRLLATTTQHFQFPGSPANGASNQGVNPGPQGIDLPVPASAYSHGVLFAPFYQQQPDGLHAWHVAPLDLLSSLVADAPVNAFDDNNGVMPTTQNFTPTVNGLPDLSGSLAVADVTDQGTGATDEVVYAPTQANGGNMQGGVTGLWFRTWNEPLQATDAGPVHQRFQPHGARSTIPWFLNAPANGGIDLRPVVHIVAENATTGAVTGVTDYTYASGAFTVSFGLNQPPDISGQSFNPQQHYMEVDLATGIQNTATTTYSVSVDYALDWPGDVVNGTQVTGFDMQQMTSRRMFSLYPISVTTGTDALQGGVAIAPDDTYVFNGDPAPGTGSVGGPTLLMEDNVLQPGTRLEDRVYDIADQFPTEAVGPGLQLRSPQPEQIRWMWSPIHGGAFANGDVYKPRLINTDNFQANVGSTAAWQGTVVQGAFRLVGQPVVSNGTVYAVANATFIQPNPAGPPKPGFAATVILALQQHINATINLDPPVVFSSAQNVSPVVLSLKQPDLVNSKPGQPAWLSLTQDKDFTLNLETDGDTQVVRSITVNDFRSLAGGGDAFNLALPIYIQEPGNLREVVNPATGYGPLDNLEWFLVIPNTAANAGTWGNMLAQADLQDLAAATSGPTVAGSTLYYCTANGQLVSVDLKNAAKDGRLMGPDGSSRVYAVNLLTSPSTGTLDNQVVIDPPAATTNMVVTGTPTGISALDNQLTLIADSNRLLEVDAAASAVWSLDSTLTTGVAGGPLGGTGSMASQTAAISHPTVVRQVDPSTLLVVDTGNDRVMEIDRGGKIVTTIHSFSNDMQVLRPGDPLTLNQPVDAQVYTENVPTQTAFSITSRLTGVTYTYKGQYLATHYVIADRGNYRAIEIVDIVDPKTGAYITMASGNPSYPNVVMNHQVIFTTQSLPGANEKYRYRTIQQFVDPVSGQIDMVAAVDNVRPSGIVPAGGVTYGSGGSLQSGPGGGVMLIKRYGYGPPNTDGDVAAVVTSITIRSADGATVLTRQPIVQPTWFHAFYYNDPNNPGAQLRYLLADANGCYELTPNPVTNELDVDWMLSDADYFALTGRPLLAESIERLTQAEPYVDANGVTRFAPHYLITNGYAGPDRVTEWAATAFPSAFSGGVPNVADGKVTGEVFEIRGKDYYSSASGPGNSYNGYQNTALALYTPVLSQPFPNYATGTEILQLNVATAASAGSSIVRMIPAETLVQTDVNGNLLQAPIKRTIGSYSDSTTTYTLQQPKFSDRPF